MSSETTPSNQVRFGEPVDECRTQLHAFAHDPPDGRLDRPRCDGAVRSDTSCNLRLQSKIFQTEPPRAGSSIGLAALPHVRASDRCKQRSGQGH